jgi:hypothetical protein
VTEYLDHGAAAKARMAERRILEDLAGKIRRRLKRLAVTGAASVGTKRLIAVLTPGHELRAGGVISIANFYQESAALEHLHQAKVVLCTVPGDPFFLKYSWFENQNYILDLELLLKWCGQLDYLQLHIPEYTVNRLVDWLTRTAPRLNRKVRELHLNVMLQNIDLIDDQKITALKRFGRVTCTTGHEAYSNRETRDAIGVTLHRLSICSGPERYSVSEYKEKESLMIVSHDDHPLKEQVLQQIGLAFPELKIEVIKDMSYEHYLKLIQRAKWSLTFGEGLDSYFVEPVFNGAVPFAVFNERFFTPPFAKLETVYPSWEILAAGITTDMKRLDEPGAYRRCWFETFELLSDLYSPEQFRENLRMFYRGEYTFP